VSGSGAVYRCVLCRTPLLKPGVLCPPCCHADRMAHRFGLVGHIAAHGLTDEWLLAMALHHDAARHGEPPPATLAELEAWLLSATERQLRAAENVARAVGDGSCELDYTSHLVAVCGIVNLVRDVREARGEAAPDPERLPHG
jgi:hypothetical protein